MRPEAAWDGLARLFGRGPGEDLPGALPGDLASRAAGTDPVRLEAGFVRLFVNALPEVPCPPYASVYLEGTLHGEVTARVRALYRRWGVEPADIPDHFAVEAAFLAGLLRATGGGTAHSEEAAADAAWLRDHLREWTPRFFRAVEGNDDTGVYAEAVRIARALLEAERTRAAAATASPDERRAVAESRKERIDSAPRGE